MELATDIPQWLTWIAACCVGLVALAVLARGLDAVFDLDVG